MFWSSTKVGCKYFANAAIEVIWVKTITRELGIVQHEASSLWYENLGVTYMTYNLNFHPCTKHIEIDYHFMRESTNKLLQIKIVSSRDQIAAGFTEVLQVTSLIEF